MSATDHAMYLEKDASYFGVARTEIAPLLPTETGRVLEIGCGAGATIKWLRGQREVRYAAGIEMNPEAAVRARENLDLVRSDNIETMELPAETFDLILALDVLEHLIDPWTVVKRLHGILAPSGALIASIPNIGHYTVAVPLAWRGRWNYAADGILDRTHLRFFTRQSAVALLSCSGLVVDGIDRTLYGGRPWSNALLYRLSDRFLPAHLTDFQFLLRARNV